MNVEKFNLILTEESAEYLSEFPLKNILREYPNCLIHVMNNDSEVVTPKKLHPAFYGCYDWHSAVHGHWMLIRLMRLFPNLSKKQKIIKVVNQTITYKNIKMEVEYFENPDRRSFERPYGWAWLLKLTEELTLCCSEESGKWLAILQPLTDIIVNRFLEFLPKQKHPIRRGIHDNTAFALNLALDYSKSVQNSKLAHLITQTSMKYYCCDLSAPVNWEPNGDDFLSPSLVEVDLMKKILGVNEFSIWLDNFLPGLKNGKLENLFTPVAGFDREDPKFTHLDGLNFCRAWCFYNLAQHFDKGSKIHSKLIDSRTSHAQEALNSISKGGYGGEHWLASFAVYMFSCFED